MLDIALQDTLVADHTGQFISLVGGQEPTQQRRHSFAVYVPHIIELKSHLHGVVLHDIVQSDISFPLVVIRPTTTIILFL